LNDDIDRAQEYQLADNERAIDRVRQRIAESFDPRDASIDGTCIDCGNAIESDRLVALAGKTSRCASCARDHEHRMKGYHRE
jgi:RNA polymerase-binding transcription factor DksA